MAGETTVARALLGRRNQELVLAESALRAERVVAWVRPVLFGLFGVSQGLVRRLAGEAPTPDLLRNVVVAFYLVFCVGGILGTRRARPDPRRAATIPLVLAVVDYSFLLFMGVRSWQLQGFVRPDLTAAACAAMMAFSAGRKGVQHVVVSTVLACVTYGTVTAVAGLWSVAFSTHVLGSFMGLGLMLAWFNRSHQRMFLDLRRRDALGRLLPAQVVERLMRMDGALAPVHRDVTVLFSDVRDFTTLSENRAPGDVLALLDEYFAHMSQVVKGHDGMVNKFLGDGMLAVWNVPDAVPDHPDRALRAARDMLRKLEELNAAWTREGRPALRMGVGIHTGPVAAGMLGGEGQQEYTVIGDAVNLASRVEGLTKQAGHPILLTEDTWRRLARPASCARVAEHAVKGRAAPVVVYAPVDDPAG